MRQVKVNENGTLLPTLLALLTDTKRSKIKDYLSRGMILVNGKPATRHDHPVSAGDRITVETRKDPLKDLAPAHDVRIIYEDDALVVIDKPSGLLTIATDKIKGRNAFTATNEFLNARESITSHRGKGPIQPLRKKQIFLVHRLDRDTSGVLVFAKSDVFKQTLQENWEQVKKIYYAVVEGTPERPSGTVRSYLTENKILRIYSGPKTRDSKFAITHYRTVKSSESYSLLEVDLETGRKHQIRVHLSDLGHPVAGDRDYGAKSSPFGRLGLHAHQITLTHPVSLTRVTFQSPLPPSLEKIFKEVPK